MDIFPSLKPLSENLSRTEAIFAICSKSSGHFFNRKGMPLEGGYFYIISLRKTMALPVTVALPER